MVRRLVVGLLVAVGLLSMAVGLQRWFDAKAAQSTVQALLAAVRAGNRESALELFTPERRRQIELRQADEESPTPWALQRDVSYDVLDVAIAGDAAAARVKIEKQGFVLEPTIHLRRGEAARWKIDRIENLQIDPRFPAVQQAWRRQQGEQLAEKLHAELQGLPGVSVERIAGD